MPVEIKICGLSNRDSIDAAIDGGATHIGMIFFEKSPRHVSLETAGELSNHAAERVRKVAVTVDASDDDLEQIIAHMKPDMLQLHGMETPERAKAIAMRFKIALMRAITIEKADDFHKVAPWRGVVGRLLFDAKPPKGADLPGGNGVSFDWRLIGDANIRLDQGFDEPYMLSGGLHAGNVVEALAVSGAKAVDVSSGVESAPGQKDIGRIREFLANIAGGRISQPNIKA